MERRAPNFYFFIFFFHVIPNGYIMDQKTPKRHGHERNVSRKKWCKHGRVGKKHAPERKGNVNSRSTNVIFKSKSNFAPSLWEGNYDTRKVKRVNIPLKKNK